jgi:hypothetical protein
VTGPDPRELHTPAGTSETPRAYPLRPCPDDDPRFTFGLVVDVAKVLERHGYPPPASGRDLVELQQCLFRFLHVGGART